MKRDLIFSSRFFYLYLSIFSRTRKSSSVWKRRLTDVEAKISTYSSFAITIFSTIIFSVQQFWWLSIFLPLYPNIYCKTLKFCTNFDLFEFGKLRRCFSMIWNKNCFRSSVVMLLLKDCIKAPSEKLVKMQHLSSTSACRPRSRIRAVFSYSQSANRPF